MKLKKFVIRKIKSRSKGSGYVADVVKINDSTGCGGLHGYTDINDPALDEYRDFINQNIRMMESLNASTCTFTIDEDVDI